MQIEELEALAHQLVRQAQDLSSTAATLRQILNQSADGVPGAPDDGRLSR
jgi:hypothetical protein